MVQRSDNIFKELLRNKLLSKELLELFFSLTKSEEYRVEVYKIIKENSFWMEKEQIDFMFTEITKTPPSKLGLEVFNTLSEFGKYAKAGDFQQKVSEFFWNIISGSDQFKGNLIETCITQFAEMVKYWPLEKKQLFVQKFPDQIKDKSNSSIPAIQLFTKMIEDHKQSGYSRS